jgi:uncharacterized protein
VRASVCVFLVLAAFACDKGTRRDDPTPAPVEQQKVPVGPQPKVVLSGPDGDLTVNVEVVSSGPLLQKGLMYREHLATDAGMLFLMGYETDHAFYMRNTLIPLDMIFITRDMTIAGIVENAEPRTETLRRVGKTSLYVLEVNGGWTRSHHIGPGTKVRFENVTGL